MNKAATRAVLRNLDKTPPGGMWETVGDTIANQPFEAFVRAAKRYLGDKTELKGSTIESADYAEVHAYYLSMR